MTRIDAPDGLVELIRFALADLLVDPRAAKARTAFGLEGFVVLPDEAYDQVLELEREAAALGYPTLA